MEGYVIKAVLAVFGMIMLIFYVKRKHTFLSAFIGMSSGGAALLLLHYFGEHIGSAPQVNLFNTAVSLIFGVPGAALIEAASVFL